MKKVVLVIVVMVSAMSGLNAEDKDMCEGGLIHLENSIIKMREGLIPQARTPYRWQRYNPYMVIKIDKNGNKTNKLYDFRNAKNIYGRATSRDTKLISKLEEQIKKLEDIVKIHSKVSIFCENTNFIKYNKSGKHLTILEDFDRRYFAIYDYRTGSPSGYHIVKRGVYKKALKDFVENVKDIKVRTESFFEREAKITKIDGDKERERKRDIVDSFIKSYKQK